MLTKPSLGMPNYAAAQGVAQIDFAGMLLRTRALCSVAVRGSVKTNAVFVWVAVAVCATIPRHDPEDGGGFLPFSSFIYRTRLRPPARLLSLHAHLHLPPRLFLPALKKAGVDAIVFDKDNCLTEPYADVLHPSLQANWAACKSEFGAANILVYSNWAGSADDADGAAAARLEGPWKKTPRPYQPLGSA